MGMFLAVWAVSLGLFAVPWIRYTPTSIVAWSAIYGSIVAFVLGGLFAHQAVSRVCNSSNEPIALLRPVEPRRLMGLWLLTFILGLIGFAAFLHAVDAAVGWSAVFTDPVAVRTAEGMNEKLKQTYGLWKLLTYFTLISLLLWTIALRLGLFRGRRVILAPVGLVSLAEFFLTGERTLFGTAVIWIGLFHLAWRPPARLRTVAIATACVVGGCTVVFLVLGGRVHKDIADHPEIQAALTTHAFESLAIPYAYTTSAPPTLSKLIADPNRPHTSGALTFLPLIKVAHRAGLAGELPDDGGAFYAIPYQTMNLYSWLGFFYLDYGLLGCLAVPAIFGFGSVLTAIAVSRRRTLMRAWILSVVLFVIIASPFGSKISSALTWELPAVGVIIAPLLEHRNLRKDVVSRWVQSGVSRKRVLSSGALLAVIVLMPFSVALAATQERPVNLDVKMDVVKALSDAARRAHRAYPTGRYPLSMALASQLHFSDPRLVYIPAPSPLVQPVEAGAVYVVARPGRLWLSVLLHDRTLVAIRQANVAGETSVASEILRPSTDLLNPSFAPRRRGWSVTRGPVAGVSVDTTHAFSGATALVADGTGRVGSPPSVVEQTVVRLPEIAAGTAYEFSVAMRTRRLTRPLLPEMKMIYEDGTYQFFTTSPVDARVVSAPMRWHRVKVLGIATKRLKAIMVFALDTGTTTRVRGSEWVDDARLVLAPGRQPGR
jgi:hypothetical protein